MPVATEPGEGAKLDATAINQDAKTTTKLHLNISGIYPMILRELKSASVFFVLWISIKNPSRDAKYLLLFTHVNKDYHTEYTFKFTIRTTYSAVLETHQTLQLYRMTRSKIAAQIK